MGSKSLNNKCIEYPNFIINCCNIIFKLSRSHNFYSIHISQTLHYIPHIIFTFKLTKSVDNNRYNTFLRQYAYFIISKSLRLHLNMTETFCFTSITCIYQENTTRVPRLAANVMHSAQKERLDKFYYKLIFIVLIGYL